MNYSAENKKASVRFWPSLQISFANELLSAFNEDVTSKCKILRHSLQLFSNDLLIEHSKSIFGVINEESQYFTSLDFSSLKLFPRVLKIMLNESS